MIQALLLLALPLAPPPQEPSDPWQYLAERYDRDGDGRITWEEYRRDREAFRNLDRNGDGVLTREDARQLGRPAARGGRGGRSRGADASAARGPREGQKAPAIRLPILSEEAPAEGRKKEAGGGKGKEEEVFDLAAFRKKKPVALVFGSYT